MPYWEDVEEGMSIPPLQKQPTTQMLVMYCGASGDFYQIHYDFEFAKSRGLPGVVVQGGLKNAFLAQLVTDWIGDSGRLRKLSCQHRGMDFPGDTLHCKGVVTRVYKEDMRFLVDCEVWLENGNDEKTTPGAATVELPSRSSPPYPG